jgi:hypothetical protein
MKIFSRVVLCGIICLILVAIFLWPAIKDRLFGPREGIRHSLWDAASIFGQSGHDYWIEYSSLDLRVIGTYRDFDGDGIVDERIGFLRTDCRGLQ